MAFKSILWENWQSFLTTTYWPCRAGSTMASNTTGSQFPTQACSAICGCHFHAGNGSHLKGSCYISGFSQLWNYFEITPLVQQETHCLGHQLPWPETKLQFQFLTNGHLRISWWWFKNIGPQYSCDRLTLNSKAPWADFKLAHPTLAIVGNRK